MKIKTVKGALLAAKRSIKKIYGENVTKERLISKEDGILFTEFSAFLIHYSKKTDPGFSEIFPDVSNELHWDEGIKIDKHLIMQFSKMQNMNKKKLSVLFVLSDGTIFQISPSSLIGFCEAMNLEIRNNGIYYFFPTILLTRLNGKASNKEILTKKKLSLISQINSLEEIDETEILNSNLNIKEFDSDIVNEIIQVLKSINDHLSNIEKELHRRNEQ